MNQPIRNRTEAVKPGPGDPFSMEPEHDPEQNVGLEGTDMEPVNRPLSPVQDLRHIVLDLERDISEDNLVRLEQETDRLVGRFGEDPEIKSLLKMLQALGFHVRQQTTESHPESIKTLLAILETLEQLVLGQDMPLKTRKRLAAGRVSEFVSLKGKMEAEHHPEGPSETPSRPLLPEATPDSPKVREPNDSREPIEKNENLNDQATAAALVLALETLRETISLEMQSLREEFRLLRECLERVREEPDE